MRIRDGSSDVCSSDLATGAAILAILVGALFALLRPLPGLEPFDLLLSLLVAAGNALLDARHASLRRRRAAWDRRSQNQLSRSDERRVGNECVRTCRSRWSSYPSQQNNTNQTKQ